MVTFSCEVCNESLAKKKLDVHTQRCYGAYFTCIDCSTTFSGSEYRTHTQCITEDEKYQKALYRPKKGQQQNQQQQPKKQQPKKEEPKKVEEPKKEEPKQKSKTDVKSKVAKPSLKEHKGKDLYKALKKFSKDEKKELLKRISIKDDGSLVLN